MKKIRKIVLIAPSHTESGVISKFLRFAPLGLAQIAALAPEYNYEIIDENVTRFDFEKDTKDSNLFGISSMTVQAPQAYIIADMLRARGKTVVMGGSHPSALPQEALQHADAVVIGEAEGIWPKLLKDYENGSLKKIYKNDQLPDLSNLPVANRGLLAKYKYFFHNILQISRGCPFDCSFCSVTKFFGKKYRLRPISEVVNEIKEMKENNKASPWWKILNIFGKNMTKPTFVFLDDNIFGKPSYAEKLFKALAKLEIFWGSQASINMAKNEKVLKLAAESGCKTLFVGLESIKESSLKEVGKIQNKREFYQEAIRRFHKNGISIMGAFIFGFDSDDKDVFKETVEFAKKIKLDLAQFTILTPLPGTKFRKKMENQKRIVEEDWSRYNFGEVVFKPLKMSPANLQEGEIWAWKKFYSLGSFFKRLPLTERGWWLVLKKSPSDALIRLMIYLFANFGFRFQISRSLANYKKNVLSHN